MSIFIRLPNALRRTYALSIRTSRNNYEFIRRFVASVLRTNDFLLYCNGKEVVEGQVFAPDSKIHVSFTLPGGKGGFGSMLRAIGAQIEKTTNREACRDLSGRRLRDINEEQRLKKWIAKKAEREAEKEQRRKARIERLKAQPKHNFFDFDYEKEISQLPERIDDALTEGIQKAKRPLEATVTSSSKKKKLWLDEDISGSSTSDSDLDESFNEEIQNDQVGEKNIDESIRETPSTSRHFDCAEASSSCESHNLVENDNTASSKSPEMSTRTKESIEKMLVDESSKSSVSEGHEESVKDTNSVSGTSDSEPTLDSNILQTNQETTEDKDPSTPIDVLQFNSAAELEVLGLERLKFALMARGLKCGGNIKDRAERLWITRNLEPHQYPKNLIAKPKK